VLPFTIALRPGEPIFDQVVFAVTRAAVTGQLRAGDSFPSVRALSLALKINPNTAHKIVAALVDDGLLEVRPGIGTVVTDAVQRRDEDPGIDDEVERLVIEARRSGLTLQQVIAVVREHWARTARRAG
jgi:GntR family transcriptional regulator